MKKILVKTLAFMFLLCASIGCFTACGHTCDENNWVVISDATPFEEGRQKNECSKCHEIFGYYGTPYFVFELDNELNGMVLVNGANEKNIVIPATYEGIPVVAIGENAFYCFDNIQSVVIPNSVKNIDEFAFYYCKNITSVTFSGKSQLTNIGSYAFSRCENLTNIELPNDVISIGDNSFYNCDKLANIEIPKNVANIGDNAFYNCATLTSIKVANNNKKYKDIDGNLYSKDSKTLIQYAIGKADAFFTIPDGVAIIGNGAFSGCSNLTSIVIPDSVTSIGSYAFSNCDNITSIVIPDSVASIGSYVFSGCDNLETIYCEAGSKPSGWDSKWNYNCLVETIWWGYKG